MEQNNRSKEANSREGTQETAEETEIYRDLLVPTLRNPIIQTKKQARKKIIQKPLYVQRTCRVKTNKIKICNTFF